jgi:hypothetical protein
MSVALAGLDGFVAVLDPSFEELQVPVGRLRPTLPPTYTVRSRTLRDAEGPRPQTIFVDFDGGRLHPGSDSGQAQASCVPESFEYPALSFPPSYAADSVTRAQEILAAYAVRVVSEEPPPYLPYTRVMVGGAAESLGQEGGRKGFACAVDCSDLARRELVFAFGEATFTSGELGRTIAHEVAHSWGLDHVEETDDLMRSISAASSDQIVDRCSTLSSDTVCPSEHTVDCPQGGQNAHAELLAVLGPRRDDLQPPAVVIESVTPERLVAGEPIVVTAVISDDSRGVGWQLAVDPLGWTLPVEDDVERLEVEIFLPPGAFTIRAEAMDQAGNTGTARREIGVRAPESAP